MLKIFYASALSLLLFLVVGFTPAIAHAESYTVTTLDDELDGSPVCTTGSSTDCSLREAVTAANSGGEDTIVIPANTYQITRTGAGEDSGSTGDFDLTDTDRTTITGADMSTTIIDQDDVSPVDRAFHITTGAVVTMSGLTVNDSKVTSENGGGILNEGSLTMSYVTVQNSALNNPSGIIAQYGAGIYCGAGDMTLTNVVVSGNASADPATQAVFGGGIGVSGDCNSDISRTTISGNSAGTGGGVFIDTNTTTTNTLTDVEFTNNTAASDAGGGLAGSGPEGNNPIVMNRVTFIENTAISGGGIFTSTPMQITNGTFYNNTASDTGGAMNANAGDTPAITIAFSTFTNNNASIAAGIYSGGASNVVLKNNIIASNFVAPMPAPFYEDCQGNFTSQGYNYIAELSTACSITSTTGDSFNHPTPPSYIATAVPADNGGFVQTLAIGGVGETVNMIPVASCKDAGGTTLTTDARQTSRPQNTHCDMGAFEVGYAAPPTSVTATPSGNHVTLGWTNSVDTHFSSVTIRRGTSGYPTSTTDGSAVASGVTGTTRTDSDLSDGVYYYSLFSIDDEGDISIAATATVTVDTVTQSPTFLSPGSGSMNTVRLRYTLPETPAAGSVTVTFTNVVTSGATVFQMQNNQSVNFVFNPKDSGNAVNAANIGDINTISPSPMPVLADGTYSVALSYRDSRSNPAVTVITTGVIIDTVTEAPTLTSPTSNSFGRSMRLEYTLPEVPQSNTVSVIFQNASGATTLSMDTTQSMNTTLQLSNLFVTSHVNTASASSLADGVYTVTLQYQDGLGNTARSVIATNVVLDRAVPTITVLGSSTTTLTQGDSYTDAGATATDAVEGALTSRIVRTGSVDTNTVGTYTVRYNVQDSAGNTAVEATRTVMVAAPVVVPTVDPTTETTPTDSAATDHGKITTVTKSNGELRVVYDNAATRTLTPFGGSTNFRVAVSTDKKRIIATNGKEIRVFQNGSRVARKTLNGTKFKSGKYTVGVKSLYSGYDTIVVMTVKGKSGYVYAGRLTASNTVTTVKNKKTTIQNGSALAVVFNKSKKQLTTTFGKGVKKTTAIWSLKSNGTLALVK